MTATQGDQAAQAENYLEPVGTDFAFGTWRDLLMSILGIRGKEMFGGSKEDFSEPEVTILSPLGDSVTQPEAEINFNGTAFDAFADVSTVTYITSGATVSEGTFEGTNVWSGSIPVNVGDTEIFVQATNSKARSAWASRTVPPVGIIVTRTP